MSFGGGPRTAPRLSVHWSRESLAAHQALRVCGAVLLTSRRRFAVSASCSISDSGYLTTSVISRPAAGRPAPAASQPASQPACQAACQPASQPACRHFASEVVLRAPAGPSCRSRASHAVRQPASQPATGSFASPIAITQSPDNLSGFAASSVKASAALQECLCCGPGAMRFRKLSTSSPPRPSPGRCRCTATLHPAMFSSQYFESFGKPATTGILSRGDLYCQSKGSSSTSARKHLSRCFLPSARLVYDGAEFVCDDLREMALLDQSNLRHAR